MPDTDPIYFYVEIKSSEYKSQVFLLLSDAEGVVG